MDDQEYGPYSSEEIRIMARNGQLRRTDSLRRDRQSPWTRASQVKGVFPAETTPSAPHVEPRVPPVATPPVATPPAATPAAKPVGAKPSSPRAPAKPPAAPAASAAKPPVQKPAAAKPPASRPVAEAAPAAIPVGKLTPPAGKAVASVSPPAAPLLQVEPDHLPIPLRRSKTNALVFVAVGLCGILLAFACWGGFILLNSPTETASVGDRTTGAAAGAPGGDLEIDPETDPGQAIEPEQSPEDRAAALLKSMKWLDASSQTGGLLGIARFQVTEARIDQTPSGENLLRLEISVRNEDRAREMEFRPWTASIDASDPLAALLYDAAGNLLEPAPPSELPAIRATAMRVKSGETLLHQLAFLAPSGNTIDYRLALPYAAVGRRGYIGFEIPSIMIKTLPADDAGGGETEAPAAPTQPRVSEEPARDAPGEVPAIRTEDASRDSDPAKLQGNESPADDSSGGDALRRSIEATAGEAGGRQVEKSDELPRVEVNLTPPPPAPR